MSNAAATVTTAEIEAARRGTARYATADTGATFTVIAATTAGVIVEGCRTGALGRLVCTGRTTGRDSQIRARIEFARDTGDLAGTLAFDGATVGARVPADVFNAPPALRGQTP